ncbi:MAG: histidine phosphatase family protein [Candidatus Magasanikbacteria bacterium]|nr:histidine phosphatase family protein [Candidatus Magasanikbacteria bacterium]
MENTEIYLIRHGDLENPEQIIYDGTISLSEFGKKKMRTLGRFFKERGIVPDAVVSSPFLRAIQSSQEIMSNFPTIDITIQSDERLQDPHSPDLFGRSLAWLDEVVDPYTHPDLLHLQIERPPSFTARMIESIKSIFRKHNGKTVFVVSHGHPTAFAMWQLLNPGQALPNLKELKQETGRVPYLEKGEAWKIVLDDQDTILSHEHISINKDLS